MANFDTLPSDVLRYIMGFSEDTNRWIARVRGVCKNWRNALTVDALEMNSGLEAVAITNITKLYHLIGPRTQRFYGARVPSIDVAEMPRNWFGIGYFQSHLSSMLDDNTLVVLANRCRHIKVLNLNFCNYFTTNVVLGKLSHKWCMLTELHVAGCRDIIDETIVEVARNCPNIAKLDLWECPHLTDVSVTAMARDTLTSLNVGGCWKITDASLIALAYECPKLRWLDVSGCDKITDAGIVKLAQMCPNIVFLDVSDCENITDVSVTEVQQKCVMMELFNYKP